MSNRSPSPPVLVRQWRKSPGDGSSWRQAQPSMPRDVRRVLIVDEDNITRQMIAAMFSLAGFDVTMATNGPECMDIASATVPDVIVMNVVAACERYCDIAKPAPHGTANVTFKVVLITSPTQHSESSCTAADVHLAMPFDIGEAIETVRALA